MRRSFSDELSEDREFEFGGEIFEFRPFHWSETVDMLDTKLDESLVINEDGSYSFKADAEFCIKEIPKYLDGGAEAAKRFKAVLARKQNPVPHHQITDLYIWLRRQVQMLPTSPPSSSGSPVGPGGNGSESSAGSSSTEATSTG